MKIVVLGATGGIGVEIVKQAIERGHSVRVFARSPERLTSFADRIGLFRGNLLNSDELAQVIEGQDAVLSTLGPRMPISKADSTLLRRFAAALSGAMSHVQTRRVIVVSTAFLFRDSVIPPAYLVGRLFFPDTVADASAMESIVCKNGLDWTIVRPPRLTDKPRTGRYRVQAEHLPRFGFTVARADVADFMIRTAEDGTWISKVVGVCA